jgi:hypothetical protein
MTRKQTALPDHFRGERVHPRAVCIPQKIRETIRPKEKIRAIPARRSDPTETTRTSFRKSANEAAGRMEIRKQKENR